MANSNNILGNGYRYETFGLNWSDVDKWNWTQYNAPLNINLKKDQTAFEKGSEHKDLGVIPKIVYLYELFRKEISSSEYDSPEYGYSFPFFQQDLPKVEYISKYGQRQLASESKPRLHAGVDLSCPEGTPIHSIADGTVYQNDYQEGGAGNYIVIKHSDGRFSIYMHMRERSKLSQSKSVKKGEIIGYSGNTGGSEGPHLHFQINKAISTYFSTDSEDPCKYFTRLANKLNAGPLA